MSITDIRDAFTRQQPVYFRFLTGRGEVFEDADRALWLRFNDGSIPRRLVHADYCFCYTGAKQ
jgi:hypothetical protein